MELLIGLSLLLLPFILGYFLFRCTRQHKSLKKEYAEFKLKYTPILDIQDEVNKERKTLNNLRKELTLISNNYKTKKQIYDDLINQINIYDDDIEMLELGFYKPQFNFDDSETYKAKIREIKSEQKYMVSNKDAVICTQEWVVEGSKSKGKTMTNRNIRLISRAFNNECDAVIAKVKWNNVQKAKERIVKAYEAINKMSESMATHIAPEYLDLKLKELALTHEYADKKQQEKEEQAEIRLRMREEAKLEQEILKAQKEEEKYQKLLEKAKRDAEQATGVKLEAIEAKMFELEKELNEAHSKNMRAKSMAEQTRAGHVYIISNIGSFGENIYKIGMTRRLEPLDRVKELGDASVPFIFDVHAMIYSEDAPTMEKSLHKIFETKRVNLVNNRKEFFRVSLEDVKNEALKYNNDTVFIETMEAREYHESLAIRAKQEEMKIPIATQFPDTI